jgi:hypothetical protein
VAEEMSGGKYIGEGYLKQIEKSIFVAELLSSVLSARREKFKCNQII